jgi:hypothetical protein
MILKAKERGGGKALGDYLLRQGDNEHVELHEMRGFLADDLPSALKEIDAISRATRAKNCLFSMSFNPPPSARVSVEKFESAIEAVERKLGLEGQPRAVVFHEVDGRRHAHCVWSRIDAERMVAIPLPHYKLKLRDVSREQFIENGWQLPRGYINSKERDPAKFSLVEWQQAKRSGQDPRALKAMFAECWAASDSGKAFAAAIKARGYTLARGDRRGHVAVDYRGEVYAVARYAGVKTKDVRSRLGDGQDLPSVAKAKDEHAQRMTDMLRRHVADANEKRRLETERLALRRREIVERQRQQRTELLKTHAARHATETRERSARFPRGLRGFWDRLTGKHSKVRQQNEREAEASTLRDRAERDRLITRQLVERKPLHEQILRMRQDHREQVAELHRDIADFGRMRATPTTRETFTRAAEPSRSRSRERDRDFER